MDNKGFFIVALIALILVISCVQPASIKSFSKPDCQIQGKSLGVLPFYCVDTGYGLTVSDSVGNNFIASGFRVIERSYSTKIIQEQGLSTSGLTESVDIQKIGKICNVDFLLVGNVDIEKVNYTSGFRSRNYTLTRGVTARIVNVASGEVIVSVTYSPKEPDILMPVKVGDEIAVAIKNVLKQ